MHQFNQLTTDDVVAAVCQLPDKQSATDQMPTRLLKQHVDLLAPFLTALFNRSLSLGVVPPVFKAAYITPRLKKPDLYPADVKSFRPISNLTVLSKLLECLVARQLLDHVSISCCRASSLFIGHNTQLRRRSSKSCRTFCLPLIAATCRC